METRSLDELLGEHNFFEGMDPRYLTFIAGCGRNVAFHPGAWIARDGDAADSFYAIRHGQVAIEVHSPRTGALVIQTLGDGAVLGWSWLFPPYRWHFDVRAVEPTRAVQFDGTCLRGKCDDDPAMGYEFMKRFARVLTRSLEATRLQLLDVYGEERAPAGAAATEERPLGPRGG
jgi:CRP/FNR family cyclic AMP-dependent transcriptional regulator